MKAAEVAKVLETVAPISSGMEGDELGFIFGDPEIEVSGVAVCWSPTLEVIGRARELNCNLVISHEPLFFQKRWSADVEAKNVWFDEAEDDDKVVNRNRAAALKELGACVYRAHSNWDLTPEIGVRDALISLLELGPPIRLGRFTSVHEIAPITVRDLAQRVRDRLGIPPVRVVGDPDREVTLIGTLYGGLGQMFNSPEELANLGAEALVAGECLAYTLWNAKELGVALIEAGHGESENPGMRAMARWLAERLEGVDVEFVDTGQPWSYV